MSDAETPPAAAEARDTAPPAGVWALAIHGGASELGTGAEDHPEQEEALEDLLRTGLRILAGGGTSLDAVETVVRHMENDDRWNAGRGAALTHDGRAELDASIMNGQDLSCGGAGSATIAKNPISLARAVMEKSPHVLFVGSGADRFAGEVGVELVENEYFVTQRQKARLDAALAGHGALPGHGTVGAVALDLHGNLAAATSTGGTHNKSLGRVGDSPIIGAGTYADNRSCAVSCTGKGEEFIRHAVAHDVAARILHGGHALEAAAIAVLDGLRKGDGGLIAVDKQGRIAMVFNTTLMFRGAADSRGRFEVAIR